MEFQNGLNELNGYRLVSNKYTIFGGIQNEGFSKNVWCYQSDE